eukprot:scaffold12859_cov125-Skeletonema_dohrnii-CCMP3373.AAC.4
MSFYYIVTDCVKPLQLSIVILTALDTIWCYSSAAAVPNRSSSGHLRRCSDADTTKDSLSRAIYPSILS